MFLYLLAVSHPSHRGQSGVGQVREAKAHEKAQFRALHEGKYLPLKKRCAAFEKCACHPHLSPAQSCAKCQMRY